MNTITLKAEYPTNDSFAPYGKIVRRPDHSQPNLAAGAVESWSLPFESGSKPLVMFNRFHDKGREFSVMEKHRQVTQCFFPLGGTPYIMVVGVDENCSGADDVAQGSAPGESAGNIAPEHVRAFHIEGGYGILLWRDVWHSLARYPVGADYIDFGFLTDVDTQQEIERHLAGGPRPTLTDFTDFAETHQTRFIVSDVMELTRVNASTSPAE